MIDRLLIATTNRGKVAEFRRLLTDSDLKLEDLTAHGSVPAPEETGRTFSANATLKASYYARALKTWTLADDSGLSVDALSGCPGVHSARWAEMHHQGSGDAANNALLLKQLENTPDSNRTARFICTLALSNSDGLIICTATDWVQGRLLHQPRGQNGFGYDPLFFVESHGRTTAELNPDEKNSISHRGKASRRMIGLMNRYLRLGT